MISVLFFLVIIKFKKKNLFLTLLTQYTHFLHIFVEYSHFFSPQTLEYTPSTTVLTVIRYIIHKKYLQKWREKQISVFL